ncbi:MAG TPA: malto-oligosyltrehalose trehalohydrolase [Thermomicrobiales bacterium]|nr:malto-oligosyltrehalose trehalohydrolase [Thermomicrobiales bacterium]
MMTNGGEPALGANVCENGVHFAVWAPKAKRVEVELPEATPPVVYPLTRRETGVHDGFVPGMRAGARYRYRLDGDTAYPDPYSRYQPEGVHGPSEVIDPSRFQWTDQAWSGLTMDNSVTYELHVGTYTPDGTFAALERELPELARLGVTAIELLPVAECPGRWNWGYDGVDLFAPSHNYGRPDDLRRLVNAAHRLGLGVILDVVYNHFGPDGNYLRAFSDDYFTDRHQTPWGDGINYDGPNSSRVRQFMLDNARSWIREFHIDGLRLDATDTIVDESPTHILTEIGHEARAATGRDIVLIAEDARNDVRLIHPVARGGNGLDAVWADDFHHELRVLLTRIDEGYYANYAGSMEDVALALDGGFLFQGRIWLETGEPRGTRVTDEPARSFVFCIQNHDQVGNRPFGDRLNHEINAGRYAVASTLLLFAPESVLLFMGQEFAASTPFLFFTDHEPDLGRLVTEGRRQEFQGFRPFADEDMRESIPDPQAPSTFFSSKLRLSERRTHRETYELYRALLRLRRDDPVLSHPSRQDMHAAADGAELITMHRWHGEEHRLLLANIGAKTSISLAKWPATGWRVIFSTAQRRFGGSGYRPRLSGRGREQRVEVPARTAVLLAGMTPA